MKKRLISIAISAAFVLAVFSGCAAMRRYTTDRGINALDRNYGNRTNYYAQGVTTQDGDIASDPNNVFHPEYENAQAQRVVTIDHLTGLIGMGEYDVNTVFGNNFRMSNNGTSAGRVYNHMLYGNATDIDVTFDKGNSIEQISVTASQAEAQRWMRELNSRYGNQMATGEWIANGKRVTMQPYGNDMRIVFSNVV